MIPEAVLSCSQEPLSVPVLSQINPARTFPHSFFKIYFNILLSTLRSFEWRGTFQFCSKMFVRIAHLPMHAASLAHIILLYFIILMIFDDE